MREVTEYAGGTETQAGAEKTRREACIIDEYPAH